MHPKLKTLRIKKLFGRKDIELHFNDVTVLVGKNGLGKTTLLKILHALLMRKNCAEIENCRFAELTLSNEQTVKFDRYTLPEIGQILPEEKSEKDISSITLRFLKGLLGEHEYTAEEQNIFLKAALNLGQSNPFIYNSMKPSFILSDDTATLLDSSVKIDFISTINMSANSQQILTGSDGRQGNFLDWEIEREVSSLIETPRGKYTLAFIKEVNRHFADSGKKLQIKDGLKVFTPDSKVPLAISKLSSGERQLLYIMAKVANTKNSPAFLLMDEPEISLHLNWQEKLLDSIKTLNPHCQIVVVTHSPAIIMEGYMDSYIDMENIVVETRNV